MSLSTLRKQEETTHSIDLPTLLKHLSRLVEWETFGALVGVPSEELRRIKDEYSSLRSRVMHLLDYWIKNGDDVSWDRVVEALESIPEEKYLANKIPLKYKRPQAIHSVESEVVSLNDEEEFAVTLEGIKIKFTRLVSDIEKALKKEADLDNVVSFVSNLLQDPFQPQPESIRQLFSRLLPHYCFMSYKILKLIVLEFVEEAMGERIEKYSNELSNWLESTTVQEFKAAVEKAAYQETVDPSPSQCPIVLRLEGEWLRVTLKSLWKLLEYLFGKKSSILTRIRIDEGSVLVHLFAPQSEMLSLLVLSSKKYEETAYLGIRSIQVGGLCFSARSFFGIAFTFESSLTVAIQNKCQPALIRFLLEIGTDPNGDNAIHTPLITAAMSNNMEALSLLMEYNVDIFMFNKRKMSAIHMAAYKGNVDVINFLLKAGVPLDHHDPFTKFTPLMAAASSDQKKMVKLLLQNGADKDFQTTDGFSALVFACKGSGLAAQVLLKAGANPDLRTIAHPVLGTEGGMTALYLACCRTPYAEELVKLLLKYHADPNISSDDGRTPLMAACNFRQYRVIPLLLQAGANVNSQTDHNSGKATALMIAVSQDTTSVSLLLNANDIDINLQNSGGRTALYWACSNGNNEMIQCLLKAKADPRVCTHQGDSPLLVYTYKAPSTLAKPIVAALLKAGADPNVSEKNLNITPLHIACLRGQEDIVQLLLKAKANINALDRHGNTPLCLAAGYGHKVIVEQLLLAGADIELEKNGGFTPLFIAAAKGHLEIIKILIQNGASIKRNRYGTTPQAIAAKMGYTEIFEFLSEASSKTHAKAKKIISLDEGKTMKTVSKDDVQPSNDDILSYYNNSFSSGPESIKQFQDNKKEYNLESLEATKLRPKIVISSS